MKSMKKQYVKPELYFENFQLSTSIAACDNQANHGQGTCPYEITGGRNVFISATTGCLDITAPDGNHGSLCYHNPLNNNVFAS